MFFAMSGRKFARISNIINSFGSLMDVVSTFGRSSFGIFLTFSYIRQKRQIYGIRIFEKNRFYF